MRLAIAICVSVTTSALGALSMSVPRPVTTQTRYGASYYTDVPPFAANANDLAVVWGNGDVSLYDADARLIATPHIFNTLALASASVATDGTNFLVVDHGFDETLGFVLRGHIVDARGNSRDLGIVARMATGGRVQAEWNGERYLIVMLTGSEIHAFVLARDGTVTRGETVIAQRVGPLLPSIACNESDCRLAYISDSTVHMLTMLHDGTVMNDTAIESSASAASITWDGRRYLLAYIATTVNIAEIRGDGVRELSTIPNSAGAQTTSIASNGSNMLVAWRIAPARSSGQTFHGAWLDTAGQFVKENSFGEVRGSVKVVFNGRDLIAMHGGFGERYDASGTPHRFLASHPPFSPPIREKVRISGSRGRVLITYFEAESWTDTGEYVPAGNRAVLHDRSGMINEIFLPDDSGLGASAAGATTFIVVGVNANGHTTATRITRDGRLIDRSALDLAAATFALVTWNGSRYVVVTQLPTGPVRQVLIGETGDAIQSSVIAREAGADAIASNGKGHLVVRTNFRDGIYADLFDSNGAPIASTPLRSMGKIAAASDGFDYVLLQSRNYPTQTLAATRINEVGTIVDDKLIRIAANVDYAIVWDGISYVVVWQDTIQTIGLTMTADLRPETDEPSRFHVAGFPFAVAAVDYGITAATADRSDVWQTASELQPRRRAVTY